MSLSLWHVDTVRQYWDCYKLFLHSMTFGGVIYLVEVLLLNSFIQRSGMKHPQRVTCGSSLQALNCSGARAGKKLVD
jgi:hypothetical protein